MTRYRERAITPRLLEALAQLPVVVVTGMRQVGKSTLLQRQPALRGRRYVSLDEFAQLEAAKRDPEAFVRQANHLTIDEAQRCPELFLAIKRAVDQDRRPGRFLLSGSANFALLHRLSESLAGRAVYLTLHPFTRRELASSRPARPLVVELFEAGHLPANLPLGEPMSPREVLRGGMPSVALGEVTDATLWFRGYEQTYLERDVRDLSQVADLVTFRHLLKLAALRTGQILKQSELARDAKLNSVTAGRYLGLMEASYLLTRLPPYLRSRSSRLIKSPKVYVADAGLACYLTGVGRLDADADEPLRGAMIETYVAQNLAALLEASWPNAQLMSWHVQGRYEVDFIIEVGRETLAIEVTAASRWQGRDLVGLQAALQRIPRCRAALLAYQGREAVALGERLWAVPLHHLLS